MAPPAALLAASEAGSTEELHVVGDGGLARGCWIRSGHRGVPQAAGTVWSTPIVPSSRFTVHLVDAEGNESHLDARAVIDASGTWRRRPNPLDADGLPALGERAMVDLIAHHAAPHRSLLESPSLVPESSDPTR